MTKKGPLSKAERFYIENNLSKKINELCADLDRAKSIVEKYIGTLDNGETPADTLMMQQFARNNNGATVMTQNASEMVDDNRMKRQKRPPQRTSRCTTGTRRKNG